MGSELPDEPASSSRPPSPGPEERRRGPRRGRIATLAFLVVGLGVAAYLGKAGPQEQHVRIVLGNGAPQVTAIDLQYVPVEATSTAEAAREAHFSFERGAAPRVVPHEPKLPHGEYRLQIDIDTHDHRRSVQRQVTLGGGSTQIDVSSVLGSSTLRDEGTP